MYTKNTGITRIFKAFVYSCQGFKYAFFSEAAFRQEAIAAALLVPVAIVLPVSRLQSLTLILGMGLVLVVELLNSAIEAVVDRVGTEHHELAGRAKDMGSAAVLLAMFMCVALWVVVILGI